MIFPLLLTFVPLVLEVSNSCQIRFLMALVVQGCNGFSLFPPLTPFASANLEMCLQFSSSQSVPLDR